MNTESVTYDQEKFVAVWKKAFPSQIIVYDGFTTPDGDGYKTQDLRILFIGKEPNDPKGGDWSFYNLYDERPKYNFGKRLAQWSYGIFHNFPEFEKVKSDSQGLLNAIHSIALINLKKVPGGSAEDTKGIDEMMADAEHVKLLQVQINELNPHLIIGVFGQDENADDYRWKPLFPQPPAEWERCGSEIFVGSFEGRALVSFYHPSYRVPSVMLYILMEKVFRSKRLQKLLSISKKMHS